jgi:cobalamin biosynthesis protein CobW
LARIEKDVSGHIGRAVKLVRAANGSLPADVLLGLASATEGEIVNRKSHHEIHHADGHEHDHDEFDSFVVETGAVADAASVRDKLRPVIEKHDILRIKGFVDVAGKPMRLQVQAVGKRIDQHFDREWGGDARKTRLVVIGLHDMDWVAIEAELRAALA